jgi:hypothetical protein
MLMSSACASTHIDDIIPASARAHIKATAEFAGEQPDAFRAYSRAAEKAAGTPEDAEILKAAGAELQTNLDALAMATRLLYEALQELRGETNGED